MIRSNRIRKTLSVLGISVLAVLCFAAGASAYLGAFRSVTVTESEEGPFYFAYRELEGNSVSGVGAITTELNQELTSAGVSNKRPFDVFQPPGSTAPNEIGFVVSETDMQQLQQKNRSMKFRVIPRQQYMKATFPFKSRLSFVVGYIKVEPAFGQHRATHGYAQTPAIALDEPDKITYLQPIEKN